MGGEGGRRLRRAVGVHICRARADHPAMAGKLARHQVGRILHGAETDCQVHALLDPIRFGSGSWTAATGIMTGTSTKPMPVGEGKFIEPSGKRFAITMATIAHWSHDTLDHEWLFWDAQDFSRQLGLAK